MENNNKEILKYHEIMQKMRVNPKTTKGYGSFFRCKSGDRLYYRVWPRDNPKKIIIGIHGLAAHGEYYVQVADQLISSNITTYALDLKHHGRSDGKKGDLKNFQELIEQVNEFIMFIKSKHEKIPIFLMGLSMGGCITVNYAEMFPDTINGIILMAPAVKTNVKLSIKDVLSIIPMGIAYIFIKGKPLIDIKKRQGVGTRNPLRTEYDESDEYRLKKISMRYLLQVNKWVKKGFKNLEKIVCPVLIMIGTSDKLVSIEGVKEFYQKLTIEDKKLIEIKGAYHCLYSDPGMIEEGGWNELRSWILAH
ncbi:MAG: alpha/beta fold hydrolase [Candidatus Helarchaeota archaeon]